MNIWFPPVTVHSLAIVLSLLTYVLTTRAEHERRPPSIAIAWVLGLIALPYVALPTYLLFGRRKLLRRTLPRSGICPAAKHWAEHLIESFGLPAAAPSLVRLHQDGAEARTALFDVMNRATLRLDICTYLLGDDAFGEEATAQMIACRQREVRVRFLIDGVGAIQLPKLCFKRLHAAGVETAIFSPLLARKTQGPRNLRNHRKLAVADGALLWSGGRNLAAEYFCGSSGKAPWLDLSFDLKGAAAASAAKQFEADWVAAGGKPAAPMDAPAGEHPAGDFAEGRTQFLPSGPDQTEDTVHALLIDACFHASQRILAVTPYFVPDASLESAMRLAARRGVRIDLFIPAKSNHLLADFARNRALRSLSDAGVSVHLLRAMNHAKAVVFDQSVALCGSPNLDSRSLLLNYESAVVFYGVREIEWLARWIQGLIPGALAFDYRAPGLWRDLCEGLLLTVAYQL
ncbi:MAG: phospholipase D-like domain-containing protein [Steroidobacteraceae bacterium]